MEKANKVSDHNTLFIQKLSQALKQPLPGLRAHSKMMPLQRKLTPSTDREARQAAVLIMLYAHRPNELSLLYTQRALTLNHHRGQICFPGGGIEATDTSIIHAALREAEEELGASMQHVQILGQLTPIYISSSHNIVYPITGWLPTLPRLIPNPIEVAQVIPVSLQALLAPHAQSQFDWQHQGHVYPVPCFRVGDNCIWGATAMMTCELLEVIARMS